MRAVLGGVFGFEESGNFLERLKLLVADVFVADADLELIFDGEDKLDQGQRVQDS